MEYIGKKILRYGELEVIGEEYKIPITEEFWANLLSVASKNELGKLMQEQIRLENYEAAKQVKQKIEDYENKICINEKV